MTDNSAWYAMPVLTGRRIRLEPLTVEHAPGYLAAAGPPGEAEEIFRWQSAAGGALAFPAGPDDATRACHRGPRRPGNRQALAVRPD